MSERWDEAEQMKKGHHFQRMHRNGWSLADIAKHAEISATWVRHCMDCVGYKPADYRRPASHYTRLAQLDVGARPAWSYPDAVTLRLVREARKDLERAGW